MGTKTKTQPGQYDKIIRENLEVTLPEIIRDVLGLQIAESEELPDDLQHTKERKPDTLKKITDSQGYTYILQVEFQVKDEQEMVYRMAEYSIMLMRKYRLPVKQFVIFLKDVQPLMAVSLDTAHHKFDYKLICLSKIDYRLFLRSEHPEVKMLSILGRFGREKNDEVIKLIIEAVRSDSINDFAQRRYFRQLRIFAQLRNNIQYKFDKAMDKVSTFFKEENDYFYRRGEKKGEWKGKLIGAQSKGYTVVENLIVKMGCTDQQAAEIAEISIDIVKDIRAALKQK